MKIGFTGTRRGMTEQQRETVSRFLRANKTPDIEIHHGDCIGADEEFHEMAGRVNAIRIVHPPIDQAHQANVMCADEWRERKTHFARNRDIVDETEMLLATPCEMEHKPRGGTWYTVDYAIKTGKPVTIVWPNGLTSDAGKDGDSTPT